ncbi:MAG: redoxin domain-containing protein [Niastella sp.]|nr:redoxin domain-containing protein [Niastella sp.]
MKAIMMATLVVAGSFYCLAQPPATPAWPVTGEPVPAFTLSNVKYHTSKTITPTDSRGKWLILDFWSKGCVACVKSFPKVNEMQQAFKENITFVLVGNNEQQYNKDIEHVYETYRKRMGLQLAVAFDSTLFERFGINAVPHVIVVDPAGKVYAITSSGLFEKETLQALIDNKKPAYYKSYSNFEKMPEGTHKVWEYFITEGQQVPEDIRYRSVLSQYNGGANVGGGTLATDADRRLYQCVRFNLAQLYNTAYYGVSSWMYGHPLYARTWPRPVLEMRDTTKFKADYTFSTGLYNYSLIVPQPGIGNIQVAMQADLQRYFGYEAFIETRMMPCWKLTATPEGMKRLTTKGGPVKYEESPDRLLYTNQPLEVLIRNIEYYSSQWAYPIIDETGITQRIDIELEAAKADFEDMRKALEALGLKFELVRRPMKVLVIRDPMR